MDTAEVLRQVDLLITSDTAVAHLAGALGVEVWLLISTRPDWRWGTQRTQSIWYPSMKIFRQCELGAWSEVIEAVKLELTQRTTSLQA